MTTGNRPLSPHLQVYRLPLTALLSITHRATGVFLSFGLLFLSCWLLSIAMGPQTYTDVMSHVGAWYGQILLFGVSFALFYHMSNGIRHLCWDIGIGLTKEATYKTSFIVIASAILLTCATWITAYACMGGAQ